MGRPVSRVSRVLVAGPLAAYAEAYEAELGRRGYTRRTSVNLLRQVVRLSRWVEANGFAVGELTGERIDEFLAFQKATGRHRASWSRPALVCLLDVLSGLGVLRPATTARVDSPTELLLTSFQGYLLGERALTAGTVRGYVIHARRFLDGLPPGSDLGGVSAAQVTAAVLRHASAGSVSAAQNFVAGLRAFLRFCFLEGFVDTDLSQATLSVTGRRRSSLPRGITRTQARALLASCDRRSTLGRRDYAMIITLLRLGLRAGETSRLRLDDLDWRAGELVVRGKGAREDRLPMPADVGEAIAGYLKRGRPRSERRELFLGARAPFAPIAAGTVRSTVRRACRRAGMAGIGAHRLRHSAACQMIAAQVPLVQIAGVLRHESLQSTALYARLDLDQLRRVAAPWPAGGSR
jgi:integrase/recombinase XerD